MITRQDFEDCEDEGHVAGTAIIDSVRSPLAGALAGLALIRAFLREQPADTREFFTEMVAADYADIPAIVAKYLGPGTRQ